MYKSFKEKSAALAFLKDDQFATQQDSPLKPDQETFIAYVDGSYDVETGRYACGVVMLTPEGEITLSKAYCNPQNASLRNVAGELAGACLAMDYGLMHGAKTLIIVHDYSGIAEWVRGSWQAKLPLTQEYRDYARHIGEQLTLRFVKVKGHSGDTYNEYADCLALEALNKKGS